MSDWGETKSILLELEQLFKRDDDIKDVQDVQKMAEEIDFQRSQHSRHLKTIIKQYTAKVVAKEKDVLAPSEAAHSNALNTLAMDKENLAADMNKDIQNKTKKVEEISKLAQETLSLKEQIDDLSLSDAMSESRTSYVLSLYSKISNISWDYDESSSGKCIAGYFGNCATKEFRDFKFDTDSISSFDIANNFWDMIAEGIGE